MTKTLIIAIVLTAIALTFYGIPVMEYKEYFMASLISAILVPKYLIN